MDQPASMEPKPRTALFLAGQLGCQPAQPAVERLIARMTLAGVPVFALAVSGQPLDLVTLVTPHPTAVLRLARAAGLDLATSWLIAPDRAAIDLATTAGLLGVVILDGDQPTEDQGLLIAHARDAADAPRVMQPRGGGCWHDHR